MINACFKRLKTSLASEVRNIGFPIAQIVGTCVKFLDLLFFNFLNLDKFLIVSSALPPLLPTTSSLLALNAFGANFSYRLVDFNIKISGAAILLKPQMKR